MEEHGVNKQNMELTFVSDLYRVKKIVKMVLYFLDENLPGLTKEDKFDLKLIFSELLCNAVIHGNNMDRSKNVHLYIEVTDRIIFSSILDEGPGYDYMKLLCKLEKEERNNSENGRGIKLVYSLTDAMSFNESGNQINFYKRVNTNGQSPHC